MQLHAPRACAIRAIRRLERIDPRKHRALVDVNKDQVEVESGLRRASVASAQLAAERAWCRPAVGVVLVPDVLQGRRLEAGVGLDVLHRKHAHVERCIAPLEGQQQAHKETLHNSASCSVGKLRLRRVTSRLQAVTSRYFALLRVTSRYFALLPVTSRSRPRRALLSVNAAHLAGLRTSPCTRCKRVLAR